MTVMNKKTPAESKSARLANYAAELFSIGAKFAARGALKPALRCGWRANFEWADESTSSLLRVLSAFFFSLPHVLLFAFTALCLGMSSKADATGNWT